MKVTFTNTKWNRGVNVETAQGPDHGGGPQDNYPRQHKRMNYNSRWEVIVDDGYDLWYHRDHDPDHPSIPPSYQNAWTHIVNDGEDKIEDVD